MSNNKFPIVEVVIMCAALFLGFAVGHLIGERDGSAQCD